MGKERSTGEMRKPLIFCARASEQQIDLFFLFFGSEHRKERMDVIDVPPSNPRGSTRCVPAPFLDLPMGGRGLPLYFGSHGRKSRLLRALSDSVRRTEYRRKALARGRMAAPGGDSRQCG